VNVRCVKCGALHYTTVVRFIPNGVVPGSHGIKRYDAECQECFVPDKKPLPKEHWQNGN